VLLPLSRRSQPTHTPDAAAPLTRRRWSPLHPQVRIPGMLFLAVMVVLTMERIAIALAMPDRFADAPGADIARAFLIGLRFDAVIAASLTAVPLLMLTPVGRRLMLSRRYQIGVSAACAGVLSATLFLAIADFYFYGEFDARLNHVALAYLSYPATYALIWDAAPVAPAVLGTLVAFFGILWAFRRFGFRSDPADFAPSPTILWTVALFGSLTLAIRGSVDNKPINSGPAYFSNSMPIAQLSLNGLFTLREALYSEVLRERRAEERFDLLAPERAAELARKTVAGPGETFLDDPDNPLRRMVHTGRPREDYNVVLVILESMSWHYIAALGGQPGLTPNLNALAERGVLFDRCFAVGARTSRGISGIVGGFPDLLGRSVTTRIESEGRFTTIAEILRRRGYETMFIQGGQPLYDHHKTFFKSNGVLHTYNEDEFTSRTFRTRMGWSDEDLYNEALHRLDQVKDRPFFSILLTLSFHRPYDIPPGRVEPPEEGDERAKMLASVRYTDWAVGRFVEAARQKDYFEKTIFVFVADHTGTSKSVHPIDWAGYRVPFLIYAPGVLGEEGRRNSAVCSQTDVAPTILDLLGGRYESVFFGSSALDRPVGEGAAFMLRNDTIALMNGGEYLTVVPPHDSETRVFRFAPPGELVPIDPEDSGKSAETSESAQRAIGVLQTAEMIYDRAAHTVERTASSP